jgi:hypothetical protein
VAPCMTIWGAADFFSPYLALKKTVMANLIFGVG